jgi:hypothetical protein
MNTAVGPPVQQQHPLVASRDIQDDSSLTPISEHEDIVAGVAAGKRRVEVEDIDFGYSLYAEGVSVACFAEGRVGYRGWTRRSGRLGDIHSLDDRYNHDIDELMRNISTPNRVNGADDVCPARPLLRVACTVINPRIQGEG